MRRGSWCKREKGRREREGKGGKGEKGRGRERDGEKHSRGMATTQGVILAMGKKREGGLPEDQQYNCV